MPAREQLLDVLPALGVAGAGRVGVGQLVHQQQRGMAGERAVEVELLEPGAAIVDAAAGQDLQALEQAGGLGPAVGLHHPDDDVEAFGALGAGGLEHGEVFPTPGEAPRKTLSWPRRARASSVLDAAEEGVGIGAAGRSWAVKLR